MRKPATRSAAKKPAAKKPAARKPAKKLAATKPAANAASASPARQLDGFLAKYSPTIGATARAVLPKMRARFPGSSELVYDNYNALAIGWTPTGKTSDVICSIALYPQWVSLFFLKGARLADPAGRLKGSGSTVRHIVLEHGVATLEEPAVVDLITRAIADAPVLPTSGGAPTIVIKSISPTQRPRRPARTS